MASLASGLPEHRLASFFDPHRLLVVSDRSLPIHQALPPHLKDRADFISWPPGAGLAPATDPTHALVQADGERLPLAVLCVPPNDLRAALHFLEPLRPRCALVLRHPEASMQHQADIALCRTWAAQHDCVVLGPGSFGLQRPVRELNLSLDNYLAPAGRVALVVQSSALMAAVLDWAEDIHLGFSALVSVGDDPGIDISDVLDFLAMDARTQSMVLYLEEPPSSRRFSSALRAAASVKPIVVLKSGRVTAQGDPAAQQRAASHDAVFNALLRRVGALRVRHFIQLFSALKVLVHTRRPRGRQIAIISNGRGPAQLAIDRMGLDGAVLPATLHHDTVRALQALLETDALTTNPVVTARPLDACLSQALLRCLAQDEAVHGILVLIVPDPYVDQTKLAQSLSDANQELATPVIACFMGDAGMRALRHTLDNAGTPAFRTPESAVEAFGLLASYRYSQTLAQQTLPPEPLAWPPQLKRARALLQGIRNAGRDRLNPHEVNTLFECFYVPIQLTQDLEPPQRAIEPQGTAMSIRVEQDPIFGPYMAFGASRRLEWTSDSSRAVELPPLNRYLARQLVQRSILWQRVLARDLSPTQLELLYEALERLSDMVNELPTLARIAIDPLYPGDPLLLAARVDIHIKPESLLVLPETAGYRHLAIHPYPRHLVQEIQSAEGELCLLRPIRPEDAEPLQAFVRDLSDESRYMRFVSMLKELTPRMLARYTSIDYDRELALVATVSRPNPDHRGYPREIIVGFAHYLRNADGRGAEYALAIADAWQRQGLGSALMRALISAAQEQGLSYIDGYVLATNRPMLGLMGGLGFRNDADPQDPGMRRVWLDLGEGAQEA